MKYSNYKTVNKEKNAASVNWCLAAKAAKSFKQASVKLSTGRTYKYGTNFPTAANDVVIIGNTFPRGSSEVVDYAGSTGSIGVVTEVASKITAPAGKVAGLNFVFKSKATKKLIADCVAYLDLKGDYETLQYGKINGIDGKIYPITFLIRKVLAAASVIAHANLAEEGAVEKATEYLLSVKEVDQDMIWCQERPGMPSGMDFRDIQVDVDQKNEKELNSLGVEGLENGVYERDFSDGEFEGINKYVNKYTNIGAVSLMVRGGFVNILNAYLSVNPPIGEFYDEMLEAIGENGVPEALAVLKEYSPSK